MCWPWLVLLLSLQHGQLNSLSIDASLQHKEMEAGISPRIPSQKDKALPKGNRQNLLSGELLVSIPLKVILSTLKDNPFLDQRTNNPIIGSRKSFSSPFTRHSSTTTSTTYSIPEILSEIGLGHLDPPCVDEFLCDVFKNPIAHRPLSDILILFSEGRISQEETCSSVQRNEPCRMPIRINTRSLQLWQWLSKYYDLNIAP
eukprot:TRINITY_DN504_c0_g1_i1.p1 TRINITY_DN504_c0_g1~~TRINITY_DN504_c0_g1_i1.p1  ORF type:complete len:201 (-),score=17.49 TRINITY_DN504_c0_g1_i1:1027-1629(-)